jgi:hypothetical protein
MEPVQHRTRAGTARHAGLQIVDPFASASGPVEGAAGADIGVHHGSARASRTLPGQRIVLGEDSRLHPLNPHWLRMVPLQTRNLLSLNGRSEMYLVRQEHVGAESVGSALRCSQSGPTL